MKLDAVTVRNFRGYKDATELPLGSLTTVVGKNDSGKSTLLEALAIFFGSDVIKPDIGDLCRPISSNFFEITCTFSDLPQTVVLDTNAQTTLDSEFLLNEEGRLCVKKRWTCTGTKPKEEVFIVCNHPTAADYDDLLQLGNTTLKARIKKHLDQQQSSRVNKTTNAEMRKALWASCPDLALSMSDVPVTKEDSKSIWDQISSLLPGFALFQSDRPSKDSDNEVQDPMKLAITEALSQADVQQALEDIIEKVRAKASEIATQTHVELQKINNDIADSLVPVFRNEPRWASLFSVSLEGGDEIPINKRGSGVRRLILVSFFRAAVARRLKDSTSQSIIYAIEEPETAQHPRNQQILIRALIELAESENTQVILTTHSPGIVGLLPVDSLRFIQKINGQPTVQSPSETTFTDVADELGILPDDRVRLIVCVEGPHDVAALKGLNKIVLDDGADVLDLETDERVILIPLGGSNLTQWVNQHYLKSFRRPEFHLYDGDEDEYVEIAESVTARDDGSVGVILKKFEMENYIHPEVIDSLLGVQIALDPTLDVPKAISEELKNIPLATKRGPANVKKFLAERAYAKMTPENLHEVDPDGEVLSWFVTMTAMVNSASA